MRRFQFARLMAAALFSVSACASDGAVRSEPPNAEPKYITQYSHQRPAYSREALQTAIDEGNRATIFLSTGGNLLVSDYFISGDWVCLTHVCVPEEEIETIQYRVRVRRIATEADLLMLKERERASRRSNDLTPGKVSLAVIGGIGIITVLGFMCLTSDEVCPDNDAPRREQSSRPRPVKKPAEPEAAPPPVELSYVEQLISTRHVGLHFRRDGFYMGDTPCLRGDSSFEGVESQQDLADYILENRFRMMSVCLTGYQLRGVFGGKIPPEIVHLATLRGAWEAFQCFEVKIGSEQGEDYGYEVPEDENFWAKRKSYAQPIGSYDRALAADWRRLMLTGESIDIYLDLLNGDRVGMHDPDLAAICAPAGGVVEDSQRATRLEIYQKVMSPIYQGPEMLLSGDRVAEGKAISFLDRISH